MHALIRAMAIAFIALWAGSAYAGGAVLKIEEDKIYVSLGANDGVGAGSKLTLYHVVIAKDPVSGKTLRDRFALGELTVIKTGERLAVATAPDGIRHRIQPGDEVELASAPRRFIDPWQEVLGTRKLARIQRLEQARPDPDAPMRARKEARKQAEAAIVDAEATKAAWRATLGKAPEERIAIWSGFLRDHPESRYAREINREIARLQAQIAEEQRISAQVVDPESRRTELRASRLAAIDAAAGPAGESFLAARAPHEVYEGTAVSLAFTILQPQMVGRAWLYYRKKGEDSFRRIELQRDGDAYLRGVLPAQTAMPPGIEYFVEVAQGDNEPIYAIGSQEVPRYIPVETKVEEEAPDIHDRSRVTVFMDYVDFDGGFGSGFDQYLHAEIDFMYRFRKPVYAMRLGFGTLGGFGGPKDIIDADPEGCMEGGVYRCRRVAYTYAYTELEYRFSPTIAVMLRPQFGSGTSDAIAGTSSGRCTSANTDGCSLFNSIGLRARLRIGDERTTNLTLSVGITQEVGTVFEAAYTWSVIPKFPIKLTAQVTDQPVPEDFGVRLIGDIGWRAFDWVYPSLRLAYQARDVDHSGVSGGVAANFDW